VLPPVPDLLRAAAALTGGAAAAGLVLAGLQRPPRLPGQAARGGAPEAAPGAMPGTASAAGGPMGRAWRAVQDWRRRRGGQAGAADPAGLELALLALAAELETGADLLDALRRVLPHLPAATAADLAWSMERGAPRDGAEVVRRWAQRTRDPVLQDLATTLALHRGTGGPLGPVLRRLAEISRSRRLLAARLAARTAEARMSALILAAMPGVLVVLTAAWRPDLLAPLWTDGAGRAAAAYAVVSWSVGVAWIRAMLAGTGRLRG